MRRRRFWGWGYEDDALSETETSMIQMGMAHFLEKNDTARDAPPTEDAIELRAPRVEAPKSLAGVIRAERFDRLSHSYGKSYRDLIRGVRGQFENPPDLVAYPRDENDVRALLDFADERRLAVIPFGGGSSVCGGVEPDVGDAFSGTLSMDLTHMDRLLEVDEASLSARIQGGALGPVLEEQLKAKGLTLRHFPQSFEFSTLGGWIATRAGGHFATLQTHIDEMVQSLRVVTPRGSAESRRLPGSGAGPCPDRLWIGSEGTLGIITEAWMRVRPRPRFRGQATAEFKSFDEGAKALHALSQSDLHPANARLLDEREAMLNGVGGSSVLILAFESADHPVGPWLERAIEIAKAHGGKVDPDNVRLRDDATRASGKGAADAWRQSFLRAPYLRDELVLRGVFTETYETAVPWSRFEELVEGVRRAAETSVAAFSERAVVTCRITHVYPDGPAPYFTVLAQTRRGDEEAQWHAVKHAITEAVLTHGGTVTHHHAVGRDVRPYYEKERPELFATMLEAAKRAVDPKGLLNPGVLLRPL